MEPRYPPQGTAMNSLPYYLNHDNSVRDSSVEMNTLTNALASRKVLLADIQEEDGSN